MSARAMPCVTHRRHAFPAEKPEHAGQTRRCALCGAGQIVEPKAVRPRAGLRVDLAAGLYRWRNV